MITAAEQPKSVPQPNRIEQLQKSTSATRLNCWQQCRLKFYFRYVLQITKPKTAALHVGSVVHPILQHWNMARWRKQPFHVEVFKKIFDKEWIDQPTKIDWDNEEDSQRNLTWSMLQ